MSGMCSTKTTGQKISWLVMAVPEASRGKIGPPLCNNDHQDSDMFIRELPLLSSVTGWGQY